LISEKERVGIMEEPEVAMRSISERREARRRD
jgi:hypothetical protein